MNNMAQLGRLAAQAVKAAQDADERKWPKSKGSLDDIVGHADDANSSDPGDGDDISGDISD